MGRFLTRAWPDLKVDLLALANLLFIGMVTFGCHLAFGWDADHLMIGWIGFLAAKSHVRLTMMAAP